jgi:prepilin-type N-terminal cleavage/methylation domain-containing protein
MIGRLARLIRRHDRDDAGFSLMEVMVGAGIMSVVMAVATGGFIQMYLSADRVEASTSTQTQLSSAFTRLDREIRYAYRVNDGFTTGSDYAITYVIPDASNKMICVQLNLPQGGGPLLRTQWTRNDSGGGTDVTTSAIANDLVSGLPSPADPGQTLNPFIRKVADGDSNYNRLELVVDSTVGVTDRGAVRNYDVTFTALNTVTSDQILNCVRP